MPQPQRIEKPLILDIRRIEHLALRLRLNTKFLLRYNKHRDSLVYQFIHKRTKRNSGEVKHRVLHTTPNEFKIIHKRINSNLLQIANLDSAALGGIKGKGIQDFIDIHSSCECYISFDLKDFFPSIKSGRIFNIFRESGCSPDLADLLTNITTVNGSLPQGFATSTMLANIAANGLDKQISHISNQYQLKYTRWVDDIVVSGRIKDVNSAAKSLIGAVQPHGFRIKHKKTNISRRKDNHPVLGICIQKSRPSIPHYVINELKNDISALVDRQYEILNIIYSVKDLKDKNIELSFKSKIDHIRKYHNESAEELMVLHKEVDWDLVNAFKLKIAFS